MSEKKPDPAAKLRWFSELVENVPKPKDDSLTSRMVDIESARIVRRAGEVAMNGLGGEQKGSSIEKGVARGLEGAASQAITERLVGKDPIRSKVDDAIGEFVSDAIKARLGGSSGQSDAEKELAEIHRREDLTALFGQIKEELIEPMTKQVQDLAAKIEERPAGGKTSIDDAVEMVMGAQERAKKLLEKQGYSIESVHVSKEDVKKMMEEEQTRQTNREAHLKEDWEKESGAQVEIEKQRITATENVLNTVVDRVMDIFLVPVKEKIQAALEAGAFK